MIPPRRFFYYFQSVGRFLRQGWGNDLVSQLLRRLMGCRRRIRLNALPLKG